MVLLLTDWVVCATDPGVDTDDAKFRTWVSGVAQCALHVGLARTPARVLVAEANESMPYPRLTSLELLRLIKAAELLEAELT